MIEVIKPGLETSIQDYPGRIGYWAQGFPPSGPMDSWSFRLANLLVGNSADAAGLECQFVGPALKFRDATVIAVCGADMKPTLEGQSVPMWESVAVGAGQTLALSFATVGARAYIAVAGGIAGDRWLGSFSTNLLVARGGMHGRQLVAGDVIAAVGEPSTPAIAGRHLAEHQRPDYGNHALPSIPGPHVKRLSAEGRRALFGSSFKVSRDADRMGYRLEGPALDAPGEELLSFGLTAGAIQVPRSGQPILLMADHQTAGGYPVVAVVVSAAMPVAAQLLPGDELSFADVSVEAALQMRADQRAALDSLMS